MLKVNNVHKTFFAGTANEKKALQGVTFTLEDGDFCTVIGSNGAGKSTTLNAIAGVFPIDRGSIVIDGVDITRMPEHRRAAFIGRVFQDPMKGTAAGMMIEDVRLAVNGTVRCEHYGRLGGIVPEPEEMVKALKEKFL